MQVSAGTACPTRPSLRGRPSKLEAAARRERFLDYALACFMDSGYRATTLDGLAAGFGASKSTIYRVYGSKSGLLWAAMQRGVPLLSRQLAKVSTARNRRVSTVLRDFAAVIHAYRNDPRTRAVWRAVSEAREDLGEHLEEVARLQTEALSPIIDYLARLDTEGTLAIGDPQAAAACFSELVSGGLAAFLGNSYQAQPRGPVTEFALSLFLNGILPRAVRSG